MVKKKLFKLKAILGNKYNRFFGNANYGKFVVISHPRTGSTLLMSLLRSHKNIKAFGEKFKHLDNKNCNMVFNQIFPKKSFKHRGFKIFYNHPSDSNDRSIWDLLKNNQSIKVIHLRRENLLRAHISYLIALKTKEWSSVDEKENGIDCKKVHIDFEKLFKDFETINNNITETRKTFQNHDFVEILYEDLIKERDITLENILTFLGVPQRKLNSRLEKQNPEKIKNLVSNYEELHKKLVNTEYSFMLKE